MKRALLLSFALLWAWGLALAQGLQPVPQLTARVIDQTGTLDTVQAKALEDKLAAFEASKGTQIVVLMVATTQPEDIASYANRIGNAWKIGREEVGDGLLLVVAKNDRKVRIEVAKTLEGAVPDLAARRVIDEAITPRFRQGDFAGGLQAAADQLIALVSGETLPEPSRSGGSANDDFDWIDLALVSFFAVPVVGSVLRGIFGSKLGALGTGGLFGGIALLLTASLLTAGFVGVFAMIFALVSGSGRGGGGPWVSSGGGGTWSGRGGGWDSGGGFSSGGGGDFGGGGASGDW